MKEKKIPVFFLYFFILLYFEGIFKALAVQNFISTTWIYVILYHAFLSCLLTGICLSGKEKQNRIVFYTSIILFFIWFCAEVIFKNSFHVYFSFTTLFFVDQAMAFFGKVIEILLANIFAIILLFIPVLTTILLHRHINFTKISWSKRRTYLFLALLNYVFFLGFLLDQREEYLSPYQLYMHLENNALNKETFGAMPSVWIEIRKLIWKPQEEIRISEETEESLPITYEKNILDIPFEQLAYKETDPTLKNMHEYFLNDHGTSQNEYTGYAKEKNLILFMAESFNSIAVDPNLTPTLYRLTHEGFQFENFYSPVILSTIGGEFQELTGLYPNLSMLSNVWRKKNNTYPFGWGKVFEQANYQVQAYHNHKYYFQNRDNYLSSLGFKNYQGCGNGLETKIDCTKWPESDLELIKATIDDSIKSEQPFFTYYVTVSGHMSYNFTNNDMAIKNKEKVKDLNYSEDIKAYLASQIELDKALEYLITRLKEEGKLKDTVIALVGDHYPYDISLEHINEIANPKRDKTIEINRSHFILWNEDFPSQTITKVGGNMDVLPTILNLFGLPYDSRLIMGKDLLSPEYGLVIFADSSWVSDLGTFYASEKKFVPKTNLTVPDDYVTKMNQVVSNRINLSKLILEKDYYKKVLGE